MLTFCYDRGIFDMVGGTICRLIRTGVPDDEAIERAFAITEKMLQGMLDRGWAAMGPTLDERCDDPFEHIFLKTGVTRQAELVRLWTGLISPTASNL